MRKLWAVLAIVLALAIAGCGGEGGAPEGGLPAEDRNQGVETGTPEPLDGAFVLLTTDAGGRYRLRTDDDGKGFVERLDADGNTIEKVAVSVTIDKDGKFTVSVTFADGKTIVINGSVDAYGNIVPGSMQIVDMTIIVVVIVVNPGPVADAPIYPLTTSGTKVTVHNLGKCGDYSMDAGGASKFDANVTCNGEQHSLSFSGILYENGTITSFDVTIDGTKYLYLGEAPQGGGGGGGAQTDTTPPVVTASPSPGNYSDSVDVTLASNEAATIYYTTDGSDPSPGSPAYASPLHLVSTTTIKYFGVDGAGNRSSITSATYTVTPSPPPPPAEYVEIDGAVSLKGVAWDGVNVWVLDKQGQDDLKFYKVDTATGKRIGNMIPITDLCGSGGGLESFEWDGQNFWTYDELCVPHELKKIRPADGAVLAPFGVDGTGQMTFGNGILSTYDFYEHRLRRYSTAGALQSNNIVYGDLGMGLSFVESMTWCDGSYWLNKGKFLRLDAGWDDVNLEQAISGSPDDDMACDGATKSVWIIENPMNLRPRLYKVALPQQEPPPPPPPPVGYVEVDGAKEITGVAWDGVALWVLDRQGYSDLRFYKVDVANGNRISSMIQIAEQSLCGSGGGLESFEWNGQDFLTYDNLCTPPKVKKIRASDGVVLSSFPVAADENYGEMTYGNGGITTFESSEKRLRRYNDAGTLQSNNVVYGDATLASVDSMTWCNGSYWLNSGKFLRLDAEYDDVVLTKSISGSPDEDMTCDEANKSVWIAANPIDQRPRLYKELLPQ